MLKRLGIAALLLAACRSKSEHAGIDSTVSSTASTTASTTPVTVRISEAVVSAPWSDAKAVMDTSLNAPNFQCAPRVFTRRDTITLRAEVPHGGWLIVAQPDSTVFTLVTPISAEAERSVPLADAEAFKTMLILRFRADLRAKPDVYGRDTLETVFRKPGDYVFTIGENLATEYDEEDPNWHCTIRLSDSP